ncbi:MAG: AAA family ATPase [Nitrososphaeria archaeon]|jgi:chromosome segregation ATPase
MSVEGQPRPFIREVILEDFMSHEYSRIRLAPGLNVILGPNGAGKSSILLAISLAMGQSHTERSRRLSELVRHGRDQARVTLLLDNSERDGRRPLPRRSDVIRLSRVVRSSGEYWFEIDYRRADRLEVVDMLRDLGLNPDNLLIIMHQGLVDEFATLSPQERLLLVEEATGISGYRRRLERAIERLEGVKAEEREKEKQLEQLRATEGQWRMLYEKVSERRELERRLEEARGELAWARVARLEAALGRIGGRRRELEAQAGQEEGLAARLEEELARLRRELEAALDAGDRARTLKVVDEIAYDSAERALAEYRAKLAREEAGRLAREEARYREELEAAMEEARGERPERLRDEGELEDEIRIIEAKIRALGDLPVDVEELYRDIRSRLEGVSERLRELARNKAMLVEEIGRRMEVWRRELESLVGDLNSRFSELLSAVGAAGYAKITYGQSPSEAGLEVYVGFRGTEVMLLDPYRQSGGERSTAVAAFLLALQGRTVSPFRAVDELDVHMDPATRATFFRVLHEMFKEERGVQYLVITPGYPSFVDSSAHYIIVQKVGGVSAVGEAARRQEQDRGPRPDSHAGGRGREGGEGPLLGQRGGAAGRPPRGLRLGRRRAPVGRQQGHRGAEQAGGDAGRVGRGQAARDDIAGGPEEEGGGARCQGTRGGAVLGAVPSRGGIERQRGVLGQGGRVLGGAEAAEAPGAPRPQGAPGDRPPGAGQLRGGPLLLPVQADGGAGGGRGGLAGRGPQRRQGGQGEGGLPAGAPRDARGGRAQVRS